MKKIIIALGLVGLLITAFRMHSAAADSRNELQTTYWPSGKPQAEFACHEGRHEGPARRWSASGQLLEEGNYHAGRMSGMWSFWNEDGSVDVARSGEYVDGQHVSKAQLAGN